MDTGRLADVMAGPIGVLLLALFVAWSILMFFAPFFWFGAWYRAKQVHIEAEKIRSILEQTTGKTGVIQADLPVATIDHPYAVPR
jgi:hypothetical protein